MSEMAAAASGWLVVPQVTVTEIATDNVELSSTNKQSEQITEITPRLQLRNSARRVKLDAAYQVQVLEYAQDNSRDTVFHQMNAGVVSELEKDHFFLESRISRTQQLIDRTAPRSSGNYFNDDNISDVFTFTISPTYRDRIGNILDLELKYMLTDVRYDDTADENNSRTHVLSGYMDSGDFYNRSQWRLNFSKTRNQYESGDPQDTLENIQLLYHYKFSPKFRSILITGYEENDIDEAQNNRDDGEYWSTGFEWQPNSRVLLAMALGERFFGKTKSLTVKRRHRKSNFELLYQEIVTSVADRISAQSALPPQAGEAAADADPSISNNLYLSQRYTASWSYRMRTVGLTMRAYDEDRSYNFANLSENAQGVTIKLNWNIDRKSDVSIYYNRDKQSFVEVDFADDVKSYGVEWSRRIHRKLITQFTYSGEDSQSTSGSNQYRQNIIKATVNMQF